MADKSIRYFQNELGVDVVQVGVHQLMCIGAERPLDHPHVFLNMGEEDEILCPYCSTVFRFSSELAPDKCEPQSSMVAFETI